jgi:hypothetical protein
MNLAFLLDFDLILLFSILVVLYSEAFICLIGLTSCQFLPILGGRLTPDILGRALLPFALL